MADSNDLERRLGELTSGGVSHFQLGEVNEVLRNNVFGIIDTEGTDEEKIGRLLALLPVYYHVTEEARATITRLRDENDTLKRDAGTGVE